MANENKADFFRIGLAVFLGAVGITIALVYFGGLGGNEGELFAETYNDKSVNGLSVGSPVNFRGVKVGEVRKISFIGNEYDVANDNDNQKIYILLALKRNQLGSGGEQEAYALVRNLIGKGLRATVAASGITGLSRIELNIAAAGAKQPEQLSWKPEHICIPPDTSLLDNFSDSVTHVMSQINKMDFRLLYGKTVEVLQQTVNAMSNACEVIAETDSLVKGNREKIDRTLDRLDAASESLEAFAAEIRDNPSLLIRAGNPEPLAETRR